MHTVYVDIIVPVHNSADTIKETVESALSQSIPDYLKVTNIKDKEIIDNYERWPLTDDLLIDIAILCHDDGSDDDSLSILRKIVAHHDKSRDLSEATNIRTHVFIGSNEDGKARGAGSARNRAASLRPKYQDLLEKDEDYFISLLDSDDIMHPHKIANQISVMLAIPKERRTNVLIGTTFDRIPKGSTWHYSNWANSLSDNRLALEKFREITLLHPTWMMTRERFQQLGGYIESSDFDSDEFGQKNKNVYRLIHPKYDTIDTLRLAEDLRLFYAHLFYPYNHETPSQGNGELKLVRTFNPLFSYRHREGQSQSASTPRKLLLQLRAKAFVDTIVSRDEKWKHGFIIWGAGRDGKEFFKALPEFAKSLVKAFVDVDEKKISTGYYSVPKEVDQGDEKIIEKKKQKKEIYKIPIIHFSLIASCKHMREKLMSKWVNREDEEMELAGRISKAKPTISNISDTGNFDLPQKRKVEHGKESNKKVKPSPRMLHGISKRDKENNSMLKNNVFTKLPVVVCVAMYRTNGVLEKNCNMIGRIEGDDLWHFS